MHNRRTNVEYVIVDVYGLSQRELSRIMDVTIGAVNKWVQGATAASNELSDWTGVSLDYLRGRAPESEMWSYDMRDLRQRLSEYLAALDMTARSPSNRFRIVVSWLYDQKRPFCAETMLSAYLRLDVETLRVVMDGRTSVEHPTILRLSDFTSVPALWFEDGAIRHIRRNRHDEIIAAIEESGLPADDILRMIEIMANNRNRTI